MLIVIVLYFGSCMPPRFPPEFLSLSINTPNIIPPTPMAVGSRSRAVLFTSSLTAVEADLAILLVILSNHLID